MTAATSVTPQHTPVPSASLVGTARVTGLLYLGMGIAGMLGFLLIRPWIFDSEDPAATLGHLLEHEQVARAGIALEMGLVVLQALTALWFYRLFRAADAFSAAAIVVFGLVNSIAVLGSAALLASALDVALSPGGRAAGDAQLMYIVSDNLWGVGALGFGLWLVPMGWCVLRSGLMPRLLGWTLIAGGSGYVLSAFVSYLAPHTGALAEVLTVPATAGEFWMIGYLLVRGVRRTDVRSQD
jgi:hypothetical protein